MKEAFVLLGFFVILLGLSFQIFKSLFAPATAFLVACAVTVIIVLGVVGLNEGLYHDTKFDDLMMYGTIRFRPQDRYGDTTTIEFDPYSDRYRLRGRAYGTLT